MAILRQSENGRRCHLRADHLVGRSSRCDLRIADLDISSHHAVIRWIGSSWEVKDLGSRYGVSVDGVALEPGAAALLSEGSTMSFGRANQQWRLEDAAAPSVMAVPLGGGPPAFPEGDVLVLPSEHAPEVTILRGERGEWLLESSDSLSALAEGDTFMAGGICWRFSCPAIVAPTSELEERPSLRRAGLWFAVSNDQIEIRLKSEGRFIILGSPTYARLLLQLAHRRLADTAAGLLTSMRGWIDEEVLCASWPDVRLDSEIYRARKDFGSLGLSDAACILERRMKTKQIRVGVADLKVLIEEPTFTSPSLALSLPGLILDADQRRLCGVDMPRLLAGEFALLKFLGAHATVWHSVETLSSHVYHRNDPSGRQLVWKYASLLRRKLSEVAPGLISACRRRGYSCNAAVLLSGSQASNGERSIIGIAAREL